MPVTNLMRTACVTIAMAMLLSSVGTAIVSHELSSPDIPAAPDTDEYVEPEQVGREPYKFAKPDFYSEGMQSDGPNRLYASGGGTSLPLSAPWGEWGPRDAHNVPDDYAGDDVIVALLDSGIDFGNHNLQGTYMEVTDPESPHHGWPMAFDPLALSGYLMAREVSGGWYANTTRNGTGPFDIEHTLDVDGVNDFSDIELVGEDTRGDVSVGDMTRSGWELDLEELYITRDHAFWYGGLPTRYGELNRTFGFAFDFDGPASGSDIDPRGNQLNFEPSHSAIVEDLVVHPDGKYVASCSGRLATQASEVNRVKIWDPQGNLLRTLPDQNEASRVLSLTWSHDGDLLAYQTASHIVVYDSSAENPDGWEEKYRVAQAGDQPRAGWTIDFHPHNEQLVAGGIGPRLLILNLTEGSYFTASMGGITSVAYSPDGNWLAVGDTTSDKIHIFDSSDPLSTEDFLPIAQPHNFPIHHVSIPVLADVEVIAWNPGSSMIAVGDRTTTRVFIYDADTGDEDGTLVGHGPGTIYSVKWLDSGEIVTASNDGTVRYWDDTTHEQTDMKESLYGQPIYAMDLDGSDVILGTRDCTIRRYDGSWDYVPFIAHRPNIIMYIDYEREYYGRDGSIEIPDRIMEPVVYRWNNETDEWDIFMLSDLDGEYMYEGTGGAWTEQGFVQWSLPREFTGWEHSNDVYVSAFVLGDSNERGDPYNPFPIKPDLNTQPHDSVPGDVNLPATTPSNPVDWDCDKVRGISSWTHVSIERVFVNHTAIAELTGLELDDKGKGHYHFGFHPGHYLTRMLGPVGVLVTNSTDGVFDTVIIDMNTDYMFDSEDIIVNKANPLAVWDWWNLTADEEGEDGIPDLTAGLLYFIADGETPIPYSERMTDILGLSFHTENPMPVPGEGELVAFYGDFDYDFSEGESITWGTRLASIIAGQGIMEGSHGPILGMSPNITFLPVCNARYDLEASLYFAVEGYDGRVNTGDEAHIVSTGLYTSGYDSGLDATTQLVEHLVHRTGSNVTFISPAGNDGSGYGTVASPSGPSTLVVGYAEDNTFTSGTRHHFGQVGESSSRGPTAAGLAKPDVIAVGSAETDMPLGWSGSLDLSVGGDPMAYRVTLSSSEVATAVATGAMALIYEAYKDEHGSYPSTQKAMSIIKSTARDMGYDPLTQGSGLIDAQAAVRMARGEEGLMMQTPKTSFGDTFGTSYSGFVNVLAQGESSSLQFDLENFGQAREVDYSLEYLERIEVSQFNWTFPGPAEFRKDISHLIPLEAQMVKVSAHTEYAYTHLDNFHTDLGTDGVYTLSLWDWIDKAPPGHPDFGEIDDDELSHLVSTDHKYVNALICNLAYPHSKMHGNLVMELDPADVASVAGRTWTFTVESFGVADWEWAQLSSEGEGIGPGGSGSVSVDITVPEDALPGTYVASMVTAYNSTDPVSWQNTVLPETPYPFALTNWSGNYWSDYDDSGSYQIAGSPNRDWDPLASPVDQDILQSRGRITINGNDGFTGANGVTGGDGSAGNPWIIENWDIDGEGEIGIDISGTDQHVIIRNCRVYNSGTFNIRLDHVSNATVRECEVYDNAQRGISTANSNEIVLEGNFIHSSDGFGIMCSADENVDILRNVLTGNIYGISTSEETSNILISGNLIYENFMGVFPAGQSNRIIGNHIRDGDYGMVAQLQDSKISLNRIENMTVGSIWLMGSAGCQIHNNSFMNSPGDATDDNAAENDWDGNYWEDPDNDPTGLDSDTLAAPVDQAPRTYREPRGPITIISEQSSEIHTAGANEDVEWGIRVWADGEELTGGTPEAIVTRSAIGEGYQSATWDCPGNETINTVNVTVYAQIVGGVGWTEQTSFRTEALDADQLDAETWTVHYYTRYDTGEEGADPWTTGWFHWGAASADSRIENFAYSLEGEPEDPPSTERYMRADNVLGTTQSADDHGFTTANGTVAGNGTAENPYIISGWGIDATGQDHAISVSHTEAHFVIMNCYLRGDNGTGLIIENASNGIVRSNIITGFGKGIDALGTVERIAHNTIEGSAVAAIQGSEMLASFIHHNKIIGNHVGLDLHGVVGLQITRNNISLSTGTGLIMSGSHENNIMNNVFEGNELAVSLHSSTGINHIQSNNMLNSTESPQAFDDFTVETVVDFIKLPHTRLNPGETNVDILVTGPDGESEKLEDEVDFILHHKTGMVEFVVPILLDEFREDRDRALCIWANYTHYDTVIQGITLNVYAADVAEFEYGNLNATNMPEENQGLLGDPIEENDNGEEDDDASINPGIMPVWGMRAGAGSSSSDPRGSVTRGDRRYFYVYVPPQGRFGIGQLENFFLFNELDWALNQTDFNIYVYGKGPTGIHEPAAPYVSSELGASEETSIEFEFETITEGPLEYLVTPMSHELITICISAKTFNGTSGSPIENFQGRGGWITMDNTNPETWTNQLVGKMSYSLHSNIELPGLFTSIVGPAQENRTVEEVYQDNTEFDGTLQGWIQLNADAEFTHVQTVENALSLDIRIVGHEDTQDLDLMVFYDGKDGQPEDEEAQWQEIITQDFIEFESGSMWGTHNWAWCADYGVEQSLKFINPPDGDYIIKVLGYAVSGDPGHFDLIINTIFAGVEGYTLNHVQREFGNLNTTSNGYMNNSTVSRFERRSFDIGWDFPEDVEDATFGGILTIGVPKAKELITRAIDIHLKREAPELRPGATGPNTFVSNRRPTVSLEIDDSEWGGLDPGGATVFFNSVDVTPQAHISIKETPHLDTGQAGYWAGDISYTPDEPLADGGHSFYAEVRDRAGNIRSIAWTFTVDTMKPGLTLNDPREVIHTNSATHRLEGETEPGSVVNIIGAPGTVRQRPDNTFRIDLELVEGPNYLAIRSMDRAGNVHEITRTLVFDEGAPGFTRVHPPDGTVTNRRTTVIHGTLSETGALQINGVPVQVNNDLSFRQEAVQLKEGRNPQVLVFTDLAGNMAHHYMNITLDTSPPVIRLDALDRTVHTDSLNITGSIETGASLTVNGKPVMVSDGNFQHSMRLSPGTNTIVVEGTDQAGNTVLEVLSVSYVSEPGRNWGAISLMVVLLILGLILGMFFGPMILGMLGKSKEERPEEEIEPPEDDIPEGEDADLEAVDSEEGEMPEPEDADLEAVDSEEGEMPESEDADLEAVDSEEGEMPEPGDADMESIPEEEALPEEIPDEPEPEAPGADQDPKVKKLREAYESGKISKDLYEKNLARFKGQ